MNTNIIIIIAIIIIIIIGSRGSTLKEWNIWKFKEGASRSGDIRVAPSYPLGTLLKVL